MNPLGGITVFCRMKDCRWRTRNDVTKDGYGLCCHDAWMIEILPGVNAPMCESYENAEEAKQREARDA